MPDFRFIFSGYTMLDESGDTVAVTGVPDHAKIAYMEDRAIGPGSEVMAYD